MESAQAPGMILMGSEVENPWRKNGAGAALHISLSSEGLTKALRMGAKLLCGPKS